MPKKKSESLSQHPELERDRKRAEFDDARLLEEEFGTPEEADILMQDEVKSSNAQNSGAAMPDVEAIFKDDADYEYVDWPDEELSKGEEETAETAAVSQGRQHSHEFGGAENAETRQQGNDFHVNEGAEELGRDASALPQEKISGSANTPRRFANHKSESERPTAGKTVEWKAKNLTERSKFGSRALFASAACIAALVLFALLSGKFAGIGFTLYDAGKLIGAKDGAVPVRSSGFRNELERNAARIESVPQNSDSGYPGENRRVSEQSPLQEAKRSFYEQEEVARKRSGRGDVQFRPVGGPVQPEPADASELGAWANLLAIDSQTELGFQSLWDQGSNGSESRAKSQISQSRQSNYANRHDFRHAFATPNEIGAESEFSTDASQASEIGLSESIADAPASGADNANMFGSDIAASSRAASDETAGENGNIGADLHTDSLMQELEARLSAVEINLESSDRRQSEAFDFRDAIRSAENDLEAQRLEFEQKLNALQRSREIESDSSQLQHSVERLEQRVDNLSIDLISLVELAAAGRSSEQSDAAGSREHYSGRLPNQSNEGALVYSHYPVRHLSDSFDTATRQGELSRHPYVANSTYSISSETREFSVGANMLAPGDYLASVGKIQETVKDDNGGLLIIASRGAFYVDPQ